MSGFLFAGSECKKSSDGNTISSTKQDLSENKEIQCRCVCDKKLSKMQKITEALEFYKNSKIYKFSN